MRRTRGHGGARREPAGEAAGDAAGARWAECLKALLEAMAWSRLL